MKQLHGKKTKQNKQNRVDGRGGNIKKHITDVKHNTKQATELLLEYIDDIQ